MGELSQIICVKAKWKYLMYGALLSLHYMEITQLIWPMLSTQCMFDIIQLITHIRSFDTGIFCANYVLDVQSPPFGEPRH